VTQWLWTAANGTVTDLSAWSEGTYVVAEGTTGQLAPAYEFVTQQTAGVEGAQLELVAPQAAVPMLGLDLVASDETELRARLRHLAHVLRPRAGLGKLTAVAADGTARSLPCYYRKGLESGQHRATRFRTVLEFWSPSPWWRGEQVTVEYGLAAPAPFFPILPLVLSTTTIAGETSIDLSDTDSPTWPVWKVTGPGSQLTLSNEYEQWQDDGTVETVTRSLVLTSGIGDGRMVLIDTRPGQQSVREAWEAGTLAERRRNLASDPSMTVVGSWGGSLSLLISTAWAAVGTTSLRLIPVTGTSDTYAQQGGGADFPLGMQPGRTYTISATCYLPAAQTGTPHARARTVSVFVTTDGSTFTDYVGTQIPNTAGGQGRSSVTVTIPPNATGVLVRLYNGSGVAGEAVHWDALLVEETATVGDYFDGDTPDTGDVVHEWTGAPNASASTLSDVIKTLTYGASLFPALDSDPALFPLVDGVNTVRAVLTNAGPASRIEVTADRLYSGAL
jgi:hypothetical protein